MKKLLTLFLLLAGSASAQVMTSVSGTITDAGGQTWNNGTITFTFNQHGTFPPYFSNGVPYTPVVISTDLDSTGAFSGLNVPDNSKIIPVGTAWNIQVCPQATSNCYVLTTPIPITGVSMDISAQVIPPAISTDPIPGATAYQDSEIRAVKTGSIYYRLTTQTYRLCQTVISNVCTLWVDLVGSSNTSITNGTPGQTTVYTNTNVIGPGSCIDVALFPFKCIQGFNSAPQGYFAEWTVDTGGVVANKLVCITTPSKVAICPAGATNTVRGVAFNNASAGQTAIVCFSGHCSAITNNAATQDHWLIPSTSVGGDVDDVGLTKPTGVQTFSADSSASAGTIVSLTALALDTIGSSGASGTVNPCSQYGIAFYSTPGTGNILTCLTAPTANGNYVVNYNVSGGVAVAPTSTLPGVATRTVAGTTDTILYSDRINCVNYTSGSAVAVTLPQANTTGFTTNFATCIYVSGAGTVTVTPTTSTMTTYNGSTSTTGPLTLTTGQWATISSPNNINYVARKNGGGGAGGYNLIQNTGTNVTQRTTLNFLALGSAGVNCVDDSGNSRTNCTVTGVNGPPAPTVNYIPAATYTIQNSDNSWRDVFTANVAVAVTLPQAGQISSAAFLGTRINTTNANCTSNICTTAAYSQSSGSYIFVQLRWTSFTGTSLVSFSDSAGDTCTRLVPDQAPVSGGAVYFQAVLVCKNVVNAGSNTFTYTTSDNPFGGLSMIAVNEYTGLTEDHLTSNQTNSSNTPISSTVPISFTNEIAIAFTGMSGSCDSSWVQRGSALNGTNPACDRLLASSSSVSYIENGAQVSQTVLVDYGVAGTVIYPAGWFVILENTGTNIVTVTPTTSTINGRSTLIMYPNETCTVMSDGTNYNSICNFIPNQQNNGTVGGNVTIYDTAQTAGTSSIGATTLVATPSAPVGTYLMSGYAEVTVVGTSCAGNTTVILNAIYTSPAASSATTLALGTFTITTNGTVGTSNFSYTAAHFKAKGSTNIQFSTTFTAGGSCAPAPTVQVTPILQVL